jgi:chromosome segregation ATPase
MNPRFDRSRKNLSAALKNLEETVKEKINEAASSGLVSKNSSGDKAAISKLNDEVNRLQNELSELGREAEFLKESNKTLWQRVENFNRQKNELVTAIESDLTAIDEVIKKYDS